MSAGIHDGGPAIVNEIGALVGFDAAWAIVAARGGQVVFVPRNAGRAKWLVDAVGIEKAQTICNHYRSQHQTRLLIPTAKQHKLGASVVEAINGGLSNNQASASTGAHERTVRRWRARLRDDRQGDLF